MSEILDVQAGIFVCVHGGGVGLGWSGVYFALSYNSGHMFIDCLYLVLHRYLSFCIIISLLK